MSACNSCWPWNLPLQMHSQHTVEGHAVPMRYEQWIMYDWHINHHQQDADGSPTWGGELTPKQRLQ